MNYHKFNWRSLLHEQYAYIDVPDYYADPLFDKHGVNVQFCDEYVDIVTGYIVVCCKVRKWQRNKFLQALAELPRKMLLCGYPDYEEYCHSELPKLERGMAEADQLPEV